MVVSPTFRPLGAVCLVMLATSSTFAQNDPLWAEKMLDRTEFKFGSVAKGANAPLLLRVKNIYKEDIQITNATTGCGCVSWDEKTFPIIVKSGTTATMTLRLDTVRYDGERKSKASVSLLEPSRGSFKLVEFPVEAYIRKDIVLVPGEVNFGTVDVGVGSEKRVAINYAGRSDWKITQARTANPNLAVQVVEKSRGAGSVSNVNYELVVTLKPMATAVNLRDQITLVTDDINNPQIPVQVEAKIEADVVVTEPPFVQAEVGVPKKLNVILRSTKKPIKIEKIERTNSNESFKVAAPTESRTAHSLPLTFVAPDEPGPFEEEFFVTIAGREQPVTFKVKGRIAKPMSKE
jgi:Protein of unknown function (DUF1573)